MTVNHHVRVYRSDENLAREDQLAWKIAQVAVDPVALDDDVVDMIITDLCVMTCDKANGGGLTLVELAPGVSLDEVKAKTQAAFAVAPSLAKAA